MQNIQGIFTIDLADDERRMKATFGAIEKIETNIKPIMALLQDAMTYNTKFTDMVGVIHIGLAASGDTRLKRDEIGEAVLNQGMASFMTPYVEFLTYCVTGGKEGKEDPLVQK